jgi:fatty acid desaturase
MPEATKLPNYSLVGPDTLVAVQQGLAKAQWYQSPVPRAKMKELMKRRDGPALRDTAIWLAVLIVSGAGIIYFWGSWWVLPFLIVYGVLYGSSGDSRWHECGHGTAFRTRWLNTVVYQIASFMIVRNPTLWRWSHTRHHTDTYIIGHDPEIVGIRPPKLVKWLGFYVGLTDVPLLFWAMIRHAAGTLSPDEKSFVPESERPKVYWTARVWCLIYIAVIAACIAMRSILPAMLIGLPACYGAWLKLLMAMPQHVGLEDNILDHRMNTRTIYMNPIFRFVYWNMNYHVEHHMFPMVPYHALPALHEAIRNDCPPPYRNLWEAYKEIIPTVLRQKRDPSYKVRRPLPPGAGPTPMPMPAVPAAAE